MQWYRDEGVKEHPILWMFYVENIQNCTQDKLLLNISWKVGKDQVHSPFKPRTSGRALSLTCLRGWWAHMATAIADALLSRRAVPVFSALLLTDTFTVRKDWAETLKYHGYLCCEWPCPNNIRIHFDLGLHCVNMSSNWTSSDPSSK